MSSFQFFLFNFPLCELQLLQALHSGCSYVNVSLFQGLTCRVPVLEAEEGSLGFAHLLHLWLHVWQAQQLLWKDNKMSHNRENCIGILTCLSRRAFEGTHSRHYPYLDRNLAPPCHDEMAHEHVQLSPCRTTIVYVLCHCLYIQRQFYRKLSGQTTNLIIISCSPNILGFSSILSLLISPH